MREGVRDLRIGCEEGIDSVSEVAFEELSETKYEEDSCDEEREDKNATTGVTNN